MSPTIKPLVASVTMGYGHLRAAHAIADALDVDVMSVDRPPLADAGEVSLWGWVRRAHEALSRPIPFLGAVDKPTRGLMNLLTEIPPLHEPRSHERPSWSVQLLDRLIRRGLGRGMVEQLRHSGAPLLTTFYAPAIIADRAGIDRVHCVVTDADCNRVWAPLDAARSRIQYLAPSRRVVRRLRSFGVPERNISLTGFPLPETLTRSTDTTSAEARLAKRLVRLDPSGVFRRLHGDELALMFPKEALRGDGGPIVMMFAVGGAGAQAGLVSQFLPSLRPRIQAGSLHLQLVAGTRPDVKQSFIEAIKRCKLERNVGNEIQLVFNESFEGYFRDFNHAFMRTDVLWTKPSELSFYPALGVPCILSPAVGAHERYNRRWLRERGIGFKQRRPDLTLGWFEELLEDGDLAAAAWAGFMRLPKHGTELIIQQVTGSQPEQQLEPITMH
jgi:hypothetical protein